MNYEGQCIFFEVLQRTNFSLTQVSNVDEFLEDIFRCIGLVV